MDYRKVIIIFSISISFSNLSNGQKPNVDSSSFLNWPTLGIPMASNDGKFLLYSIYNDPSGGNTLVVKSLADNWEKSYAGSSIQCDFSPDTRFLFILNERDSLNIVDLLTKSSKWISSVKSYKILYDNNDHWIAYNLLGATRDLMLLNLKTGIQRELADVEDYEFDRPINSLLILKANLIDGGSDHSSNLEFFDLETFNMKQIWVGKHASDFIFDSSGKQLAFMSEEPDGNKIKYVLRYYKTGDAQSFVLSQNQLGQLGDSLTVTDVIRFNKDGSRLIINLAEKSKPLQKYEASNVDVWSYKDAKLQSVQLNELNQSRPYQASLDLKNGAIVRLEFEDDHIWSNFTGLKTGSDSLVLMIKTLNDLKECNWNRQATALYYLVSTVDGSRKLIYTDKYPSGDLCYSLSPYGRYAVYYNKRERNYFSYSVSTGKVINITKGIPAIWDSWKQEDRPEYSQGSFNIAGWIKDDSKVILYDRWDIFEIDLAGKLPAIKLTNGYGCNHGIVFRLSSDQGGQQYFGYHDKLILNAFDRNSKDNGFFSIFLGENNDPSLLTMQSCVFNGPHESDLVEHFTPVRARDIDGYIVRKMTASKFPNYYWTADFKSFITVSDIHPELNYNWFTTQLITWKKLDGHVAQGILYKPENFDPNKKYPVIICYYEKLSDGLNAYLRPDYCNGGMNIPYFVSNGYLVFTPDISFKIGYPGNSVVNSVLSAGQYLSRLPFVNKLKIGIMGHSRGGYETNYLITHSNFFAAASSACGMSDYVGLPFTVTGDGHFRAPGFELLSQRIGATLWHRPDLYINNSPIFRADKITTPLLILADKNDPDVPFSQGLEFYLALRRLGKRSWMLQYDEEGHILSDRSDQKDYSIRLKQFFDHYLKDSLPPKWMTEGIPARLKRIQTGLELDSTYKERGLGGVVDNKPDNQSLLRNKPSKKKPNARSTSIFMKPK